MAIGENPEYENLQIDTDVFTLRPKLCKRYGRSDFMAARPYRHGRRYGRSDSMAARPFRYGWGYGQPYFIVMYYNVHWIWMGAVLDWGPEPMAQIGGFRIV